MSQAEAVNIATLQSDPTLGDVLRDLWRARVWLVWGGVIGFVAAVFLLMLVVPQYKADMLVGPTTRSGTPDISALFPNNASFTMEYVLQSFGPGDSSDFMRFQSIMQEDTIAALLLQDEKIQEGLKSARRFHFNAAPALETPAALSDWLQDNISIEPVGATRLKRVVFLHPDPLFASYMLHKIYASTDTLIRHEIMEKTTRRVTWLKETLQETGHPEHRRILTDLLMDQEQIRMILSVDEPYAAHMSEPPSVGAKPYWPRKALVFPGFVFAGFFLGYALYSMRRAIQKPD